MTAEPGNRIVITKEELQDAAIDERIALQRSGGPPTLQPVEEKTGLRVIYSAWFYLLLAGAFGAFVGWLAIEPFFEEGVQFTGRVQEVDLENFAPNLRRVVVSGVPVIVVTNLTTIRGGPKQQIGYTIDDLRVESVVTINGESMKMENVIVAGAIRMEPPGTPAPASLDAALLKTTFSFAHFALFPVVAGMIGLLVAGVEGIICRTFARALRCGIYGLVAGVIGGSISAWVGGLAYSSIDNLLVDPTASAGAFVIQLFRRGLAWLICGSTMGLGQGFALKSNRLKLNGFIGGMVGGLVGGLLFDPIYLVFSDRALLQGAELSRAIGLTVIGAAVGFMIGITDMLTRTAWLRVTAGPLRGKQFSFVQTPIRLGSSPKNEIYLFKDPKIDPVHAEINKLRDTYEINDKGSSTGTIVNGQRTKRKRLADGDRIQIGDSEFVYVTRESKAREGVRAE